MEIKEPKTFKSYYQDPEYRKKHLEYISEKVNCAVCESMVARCNLSKHRKTVKHRKNEELHEKMKAIDVDKMTNILLKVMKEYQK